MWPPKPYLAGMDWVLLVLDDMTRRETTVGMGVLLVLELEGAVSVEALARGLSSLLEAYPEAWSRVRRAWHLAPYWSRRRPPQDALRPRVFEAASEEDARRILETLANEPIAEPAQHLRVDVVEGGDVTRVAFWFDHRLFDARGAESVVARLAELCASPVVERYDAVRSAHLDHWAEKFASGRALSECLWPLLEGMDPRVVPVRKHEGKRRFGFRAFVLGEEETAALIERAEEQAGFLMTMPFGLAVVVQVLHELFESRGAAGADYVIPVMADTRTARDTGEKELFNQFSFLVFRVPASEAGDFAAVVERLKTQMYSQIKAKLPANVAEAAHLTRIAPLGVASRVARRSPASRQVSFGFSFLGETNQVPTEFLGRPVRRSFHMPTVPFPPGFGVFYRQTRGRMDVQLTYADGVLSEDEADRILSDLEARLRP